METVKETKLYNHNQLHTAVSLFLAACIMEENERVMWKPLMKDISNNKVPRDQGRMLMIKNVSTGAIIIFAYAIENLFKAFCPQIGKRHINIGDPPHDLGLNEIEAMMFIKTLLPLLKDGFLRYHEPSQREHFIDTNSARQIFIKIFKYYIAKYKIDLHSVHCFKVEFFEFKYPFISELT